MHIMIGVIGAAEATAQESEIAEELGREIAKRNGALVCGGLGGVMEAACRGAKSDGGLTIGIIPGFSASDANPNVDIPYSYWNEPCKKCYSCPLKLCCNCNRRQLWNLNRDCSRPEVRNSSNRNKHMGGIFKY